MAKQFEPFTLDNWDWAYEVVSDKDGWHYFMTYEDTAPVPFVRDKDLTKIIALAEMVRQGELDPWNNKELDRVNQELGINEEMGA